MGGSAAPPAGVTAGGAGGAGFPSQAQAPGLQQTVSQVKPPAPEPMGINSLPYGPAVQLGAGLPAAAAVGAAGAPAGMVGVPGLGHLQGSVLQPGMMYVPMNPFMLQAQMNALAVARARVAGEQKKQSSL
jgi:hypothetical protein